MDISQYKKIVNLNPDFTERTIKSKPASPTTLDYAKGYVIRYFVRKSNDPFGVIREVDKVGLGMVSSNPLYTTVQLDWRLTGTDEQIQNSNMQSVHLASAKISNLKLYLPYLLQFRKI